jgi:hypothetical protein
LVVSGSATISNVSVGWGVNIKGGSTTISGGSLNSLSINGASVEISNVSVIGNLSVIYNSTLTMLDGTVGGDFQLRESGVLLLDGFDFAIDGVAVDYGDITSMLGGRLPHEPFRTLTGTLQSGDIINNQFRIGDDAQITLVPEPCTMLLFIFGGIILRRNRYVDKTS